jgi:adenine-specific DNA methylase
MSKERLQFSELPIEKGYPIEKVNEIAQKEGRAKQWYRPIYTMHKWWARRLGCVFRAICLYSLLDDPSQVNIEDPGQENGKLSDYDGNASDLQQILESVELENPNSLWELYPKDVTIDNKRVLDPFMGGGTSIVEASRFGAEVVGNDLNPVAWFVTKKELETGDTDIVEVEDAFKEVKENVKDDIIKYYKTSCPNHDDHDADVMYYFSVKELDCVSCGHAVPLFNDYRVGKARYEDGKYDVCCPDCNSIIRVEDWQSECVCDQCANEFIPKDGNVGRGNYSCPSCGQKYGIVDAIQEQDGFDLRFYATEYFCPTCKERGEDKSAVTGYKEFGKKDEERYEAAVQEWQSRDDLDSYIPEGEIPLGIMTDSTAFEGSIGGGHNLLRHGFDEWKDLFNSRQLLCLSQLLKTIDEVENQNAKEYLLLAFGDSLRYNTQLTQYQYSRNHMGDLFSTNAFDVPQEPAENNVWGAEKGAGTFTAMYDMVLRGIKYGNSPTERYFEAGETKETPPFETSVGGEFEVNQGDARSLDFDEPFDIVLTDPPYYHNVIYSEISNYFYTWMRQSLKNEYECFKPFSTPRAESIVSNPAEGKDADVFEEELNQAFTSIRNHLKDDGLLIFTYHHSDSESWGELLTALCDVNFQITATYPISADLSKHPTKIGSGDSVSFDIIIVARPVDDTTPISWNSLRRSIYRTAKETRRRLETGDQELSRGDIGVVEMGECYREYSKHHGKVTRGGETMTAKEVVDEIYGIIQEASEIGTTDVFIDLLDTDDPTYDDVNKLCRGTNATPKELKKLKLYTQDDGFQVGTWDNEKRQAYIQERINGDSDSHLTAIDKLQFLRYRYEKGQSVQNYVEKWGVDDELRELAGRLADVTGDDTYTRVLGDRDITSY